MRGAPRGAWRDRLARSTGQGVTNFLDRQFGRADDQLIRQTQDVKVLRGKPDVARPIAFYRGWTGVAWPIDLDDEPAFETDEIHNVVSEHNLALKLRAAAASVARCPPDQRLGADGPGPLLAGEATQN